MHAVTMLHHLTSADEVTGFLGFIERAEGRTYLLKAV